MNETQKNIPLFTLPDVEARDIAGVRVTMRRLRATRAPAVLEALMCDFGPAITEWISISEPSRMAELVREMGLSGNLDSLTQSQMLHMGMSMIKGFVLSSAFQGLMDRLKEKKIGDIAWYTHHLLCGCVSLNGVQIDTMEELDQSNAPPLVLWELIRFSLEVNFDPTLGGLNTNPGLTDHQSAPRGPMEKAEAQPKAIVKEPEGSVKMTGQSVQLRADSSAQSTGP